MVYISTVCCTCSFYMCREDDQTPFGVWNGMVPFSYLLENRGGEPDMEDMDCTVEQLSVNLMGSGEVEVKAVLAFNCFQKEPVQIQNIESAEFRPMDTEELEKAVPELSDISYNRGIHCGIWQKI